MGSMQGPLMLSYSKHSGVNLWPSQFLFFYWNSWPWHCNCLSTSNSLPINLLNMNISDPRFAMGAAATIHVTSVFKCHCRYGSLAKTKLANGTVPAVETLISAANNTVLRDHDHSQLHPWWELLHGCYLKFKVFQGWSCCSYPQWGQWTHDWIWDSNLKELNKNSKWWWNCFWGKEHVQKTWGLNGHFLQLKWVYVAKLVKDVDLVGDNNHETPNEDGSMHDIRILKQEGSHHGWFGTNRFVCANLYNTSVRAAKDLFRKGLRFIAGVKTATKGFPKTSHSSLELQSHSDFISLISEPTTSNESDPTMASFMWMGHKSKVFYCDCWNSIH